MNPAQLIALAPLASLGAGWLRASLPAALTLAVKVVVVLAVLGNLTAFAVAIRTHFARVEGVPAVTRGIAVLGAMFGGWQVAVIAGTERWIVWRLAVGLALCAGSLGLFVAALRANRRRPLSLAGA